MPLGDLPPEFSTPWYIYGKVDTRYTVPILRGVGIHEMKLVYWLLVMPLVFPIGNHSERLRETSTQNIAAPWYTYATYDTRYTVPMWSGVGIDNMRLIHGLLVMPLVFPIGSHTECLWETSAQNIVAPWYIYAKYDTRYTVPMWSGVGIDNMRLIHSLLVMPLVFPIGSHGENLWGTSAQNIADPRYIYGKFNTRYTVPMWNGVRIQYMQLLNELLVMPLVFPNGIHSECHWESCTQNSATPETSMVKLTLDTLSLYWVE